MSAGVKFMFLACEAFAHTWVEGGEVPLNPARTYLSETRGGTRTPDEVMQRRIQGASVRDLQGVRFGGEGTIGKVVFQNSYFGGKFVEHATYSQRPEEALILCMCNSSRSTIRERLGHSCTVKIPDVLALKAHLDHELGVTSEAGEVLYTDEPGNRSHFLKSLEDRWQREYRFVWVAPQLGHEVRWVSIPKGLVQHY